MTRLLIDTNILLLYVVGRMDKESIGRFKRTSKFSVEDFDLLLEHMALYGGLVVTPGVLAEVSNLLPDYLHQLATPGLIVVATDAVEDHSPAAEVVKDASFPRLGFTDCGIMAAAAKSDITVLTDDLQLYLELLVRENEAINFNHLRSY